MNNIGMNSISFGNSKAMRLVPLALITPLIAGSASVNGIETIQNNTDTIEIMDTSKKFEAPQLSHPKDGTIYVLPCYHPDLLDNINR